MSRKRERPEPKERRSPTATLANISDYFIHDLDIPTLPEAIPQRLEEALRARVNALLFHLREAKKQQYIKALEVRLVREALQAVLAAHELGLADSEVLYASFRHLVEDLGYESADAGFVRREAEDTAE